MNFSESVKEAMQRMGKKKSDLARSTGYSYQHISDLLAGERRWNEDSINKVCEALDIKVEVIPLREDGEYEKYSTDI